MPITEQQVEPTTDQPTNGKYTLCTIAVNGVSRQYYKYEPSTPRVDELGRRIYLLCFDGFSIGPPKISMPQTYRVNEIAERCGFYAIYPLPQKYYRMWSYRKIYFHYWNAEHGIFRYRKNKQDDVVFVRRLQEVLTQQSIGPPIRWTGIGMSFGAQFVHLLAHHGLINDVVSVCGTWLLDQPRPKSNVSLIAFCGGIDHIMRWEGGLGNGFVWEACALPVLRQESKKLFDTQGHIKKWSQPQEQCLNYARANGRPPHPTRIDDRVVYGLPNWSDLQGLPCNADQIIYRRLSWGYSLDRGREEIVVEKSRFDSEPVSAHFIRRVAEFGRLNYDPTIVCYLFPTGDHVWQGQHLTGETWGNKPMPQDWFDTNETWVLELGLEPGLTKPL